jgi:hypothetical protein
MSNPFEILTRFLERYGDDVQGRELEEMPAELKSKLCDFARGGLPAAERGEIARLLKDNPRWVGVLAQEIRAARQSLNDSSH